MNMETFLAALDARSQILYLYARFCRRVDRCDRECIFWVYRPDARDDRGSFAGGPEEFTDWVIDLHQSQFVWTSHYVTNEIVQIDGAKAVGRGSVAALLPRGRPSVYPAPVDIWIASSAATGLWKIAFRTATTDWNRIDPVDEGAAGELVTRSVVGTRSGDDASYRFLRPNLLTKMAVLADPTGV